MSTGRPPGNDVERVVAIVWSEFLDEPVTDVTTSIFALGAHSLAITRCVARLQELFGVQLGTAPFFEHPTIDRFAEALANGPGGRRVTRRAAVLAHVLQESNAG
ncbi:MAG TPA: phosphopantetheine-binding protein [Micromonosporaceae bacterium]|nr:phosphopantetheine-binding protein [Micromonosporaceae bacterium]